MNTLSRLKRKFKVASLTMNDLMRAYGFVSAHKSEFDKYFPTMGIDLRAAQKNENFNPTNIMQDMNNLLKLVQVYDEYHIAPAAAQTDLNSYFSGNISVIDLLKQYTEKDVILQSDKDAALEKLKTNTVITKVFPNVEYLIIEDQLKVSDKGILADLEVLKNIANKCLQQLRSTTDEKLKQRIQDNINTYNNDLTRMNAQQLYDAYFKIVKVERPQSSYVQVLDVSKNPKSKIPQKDRPGTVPYAKTDRRGDTLTDTQVRAIKVINLTIHDMKNTPDSSKAEVDVPSIMPIVKQLFPELTDFVAKHIAQGFPNYTPGVLKNEIFYICKTISKLADKGLLNQGGMKERLTMAFNEWKNGRSFSSMKLNSAGGQDAMKYQADQLVKEEEAKTVFNNMDQMAQKYGFCLFDNQQYNQFIKLVEFRDKLGTTSEQGKKINEILNRIQNDLTTLYQDYYVQQNRKKKYMDLSINYWLRSDNVKLLLTLMKRQGIGVQQQTTTNQYCPIAPAIWNALNYDQRMFVEFLDKTCHAISERKQILPLFYVWHTMQANKGKFQERINQFNSDVEKLLLADNIQGAIEYRKKAISDILDEIEQCIRNCQAKLSQKLPRECQRVIAIGTSNEDSFDWLNQTVNSIRMNIEHKDTYTSIGDIITILFNAAMASDDKQVYKRKSKTDEDLAKKMRQNQLSMNRDYEKSLDDKIPEYKRRTPDAPYSNPERSVKQLDYMQRYTPIVDYNNQKKLGSSLTKNMRRLARKIS